MSEPIITKAAAPRVGLIDSGVNAAHPHVERILAAASVVSGERDAELIEGVAADSLGHGTACAGLLRWLAPEAEIVAVRIFDHELRASIERLPLALAFCLRWEARLINLSLGVRDAEVPADVQDALDLALESGALIVAAHGPARAPSWPASHARTLAVAPDPSLEHGAMAWIDEGVRNGAETKPLLLAAPFPRPMPGQPRERNMSGVSFAAAAVTGILARHRLAASTDVDSLRALAIEHFSTREEWLAKRGAT